MNTGVFTDIANDNYHSGPGVSKSFIDVVRRSPLHAKALIDAAANDNEKPREPTAAMVIGTAFHTLVLEPHLFADEYVCELTQADAPHAIDSRDELVAMVAELNKGRLPKLASSATKGELIERIIAGAAEQGAVAPPLDVLEAMGAKELKDEIAVLNRDRTGLFSTSGSQSELAEILRGQGFEITLWRDVRARWDAENEGMTVLSVDTYNQLLGMAAAVNAHPAARALLYGMTADDTLAEASIYAVDPDTGELRRVRPDFWRKDGLVVDLKSTEDASPEGFAKSVVNYGYHRQDPYYQDTMNLAHDAGDFPQGWQRVRNFAFIAVEKRPPYAVAVYVLDHETRELGRIEYREGLATLAECRRTDTWPGYGDKVQTLGAPDYYLRRNAEKLGVA